MIDIISALFSGLQHILAWSTLSLMLLGILIGFVVGILPGLGGPTTLALMLPFVIKMNAFEAFAFLLGMAAVTNTTGDITSILFGVPGEPTTVATIIDGHPMAKKGQAGRALGAALLSSLIGAVFGAFFLGLAIPIVRPLVFAFGSPEFFMLAILGLTFVASLSGTFLLKGLISGGMGLFLATVGLDPMSGIQRYTFGQLFLWDGIGLVPITIGFFAIPEIIDLAIERSSIAKERIGKLGGGDVVVVLQGVAKPLSDLPNVPLAINLAKTDEARKLIDAGIHSNSIFARPFVMPPETPKDRVEILVKAFQETLKDKEFIAEMEKSKLDLDPATVEELEQAVSGIFKLDAPLLAKLKDILFK